MQYITKLWLCFENNHVLLLDLFRFWFLLLMLQNKRKNSRAWQINTLFTGCAVM